MSPTPSPNPALSTSVPRVQPQKHQPPGALAISSELPPYWPRTALSPPRLNSDVEEHVFVSHYKDGFFFTQRLMFPKFPEKVT